MIQFCKEKNMEVLELYEKLEKQVLKNGSSCKVVERAFKKAEELNRHFFREEMQRPIGT